MPLFQQPQGRLQQIRVHRSSQSGDKGIPVHAAVRVQPLQKPEALLAGRERIAIPTRRAGDAFHGRGGVAHAGRQGLHAGMDQDILDGKADRKPPADLGQHLHGQQAVSAEFEEIGGDGWYRTLQHGLVNVPDDALDVVAGAHVGAARSRVRRAAVAHGARLNQSVGYRAYTIHGQRFERGAGNNAIFGHGLHDRKQTVTQAPHPLMLHPGRVIQKAHPQRLAGNDRKAQRIGNLFKSLDAQQGQTRGVENVFRWVVFHDHEMVEQIAAHFRQGQVAVPDLLQVLALQAAQHVAKLLPLRPARPQRQGLDEEPHGPVHALDLGRTTGGDNAVDDVASTAVFRAKQHAPQRLNQNGKRHGIGPCRRLHPQRRGMIQDQLGGGRVRVIPGRTGFTDRGYRRIVQQLRPVPPGGFTVEIRQPAGVGRKIHRSRQIGRNAPLPAVVQGEEFAQQDADAPTVHEQMMAAPAEGESLGAETEKLHVEQRPGVQIETAPSRGVQQRVHCLRPTSLGQMRQVMIRRAGPGLAQDQTMKFSIIRHGKQGAQAFMPGQHVLPGPKQEEIVDPSLEMKDDLLRVNAPVPGQILVQHGLVTGVRSGDALDVLLAAVADIHDPRQGVFRYVQPLLRLGGKQGGPAVEQPGNPFRGQNLGAEIGPEMQDVGFIDKDEEIEGIVRLELRMQQFRNRAGRGQCRKRPERAVRFGLELSEIIEADLRSTPEYVGMCLTQVPVGRTVAGRAVFVRIKTQDRVRASGSGPQRQRTDRREPAEASAQVHPWQQCVATVAFEGYKERFLLPHGMQRLGQRRQQFLARGSGLTATRPIHLVLEENALRCPIRPTLQQSCKTPPRHAAHRFPKSMIVPGGEDALVHKPLNFDSPGRHAVCFGHASGVLAEGRQILPQQVERNRIKHQMMPGQQEQTSAVLFRQARPEGRAPLRIESGQHGPRDYAHHVFRRQAGFNGAACQDNALRFRQHQGRFGGKGEPQGLMPLRQGA